MPPTVLPLAIVALLLDLFILWRVRKRRKSTVRVIKVTPIPIPGTDKVINFRPRRFIASLVMMAFVLANGASCLLAIGDREFWEALLWNALYFNVFVLIICSVAYLFLWGVGLLDNTD